MTDDENIWRDEWIAELAGETRAIRDAVAAVASHPSDADGWRGLERAWSRLAGQGAFFGEIAVQTLGAEAAALCGRVALRPASCAPDEVADALMRALNLVDVLVAHTGDDRASTIDDLLATLRTLAPARDPQADLRRLMGEARLLVDQWRAVAPGAPPELVVRVSALETACDEIAQGVPEKIPIAPAAARAIGASSEIPADWRRGLEQLATLRDELRDEHVSSKLLGRLDAILRRFDASARAAPSPGADELRVLCVRAGERRFAIPLRPVEAVRTARRGFGASPVAESANPIWLGPSPSRPGEITLHIAIASGDGRVELGVTEAVGEATLWNIEASSSGDPRFARVGTDADERAWDILEVDALAVETRPQGTELEDAPVAANGRSRPNAAPLLRALSRGDGR